jgi:Flp pilus assembly CpaE family ATPase
MLDEPERRVSLLLNQHDPRHHHDALEVARALRTPVAAVIPNDARRVHAALAAQRPLVAIGGTGRGSAARALVNLARQLPSSEAPSPRSVESLDGHPRELGAHVLATRMARAN